MERQHQLVWAVATALALLGSGTGQAAEKAARQAPGAARVEVVASTRAEAAGRPAVFAGAARGDVYFLEPTASGMVQRVFSASQPVYRAYGFSADGARLAYRPLEGERPAGTLVVEDMTSGKAAALPIPDYVIEAAWSPSNPRVLAYTYSSGEAFGVALIDVESRRISVIQGSDVLADHVSWDAAGQGIYYYNSVDRVREARDETSGERMHQSTYAVLSPRYHAPGSGETREPALTGLPAGFPALRQTARPELLSQPTYEAPGTLRSRRPLEAADLPADLYAFTVGVPERALEITGDNLLGDAPLSVRELPNGEARPLAEGKLLKALPEGVVVSANLGGGRAFNFVRWDGTVTELSRAVVSYNLPLKSAYVTQGGCSYPAPGNCNSSFSHTCGSSMAYAYDMWQSAGHVLASATGTVSYRMNTINCNGCDTSGCADYSGSCVNAAGNYGWGNVVIIEHADTSWTKYTHMAYNSVQVAVGNATCPGRYLGNQGHTGCTSGSGCGDHVHFQRQNSSALSGTSIAIDFADAADPLSCGTTYTSASTETTSCGGGGYTFTCDDGEGCFAKYGPSQYWHTETTCGGSALGYGGDMVWTYVNGTTVSNYVRWTPTLSGAGNYTVSVFIPRCFGTSQQAKYRVYANGTSYYPAAVNQNSLYDQWVTLGTYYFAASGTQYLELTDATGESATSYRYLAFDAARFSK
jgi:hypothetical protein